MFITQITLWKPFSNITNDNDLAFLKNIYLLFFWVSTSQTCQTFGSTENNNTDIKNTEKDKYNEINADSKI